MKSIGKSFQRLCFSGAVGMALFCSASLQAGEWAKILPENAEVQKVADGFKFTEGPAWHPEGFLVFTDIPNDRILKLDANDSVSEFYTPAGRCNGLMCDQQGFIYACQMGEGRVLKLDATGKLLGYLTEKYEGHGYNGPNDLALDAQGGMYFTDPYYGPEKVLPQPMMAVYYMTPEGKVSRIIEDLERPNGVTISPDGKTLYVAEPNKSEVYSYSVKAPGQVGEGKLIFTGEAQLDGSGPDGMTHDTAGNLYCTYNGIVVLNPEGELLGRIKTPEKPANCTFGGQDNQTLFITARTSLYKIALGATGIPLQKRGPELAAVQTSERSDSSVLTVQTVSETKTEEKTTDVKAGEITLTVPESWEAQPPSNNLRLAQFTLPNVEGETALTELVVFPPFGGSVEDNITRWIRQFDPNGIKLKMTQGKSEQGAYYFVDVAGVYKKPDGPPFLRKTIDTPDHRMFAVMLEVPGEGNYFLKLVGPEKSVAAAADAFRKSFGANADDEKEYKLP